MGITIITEKLFVHWNYDLQILKNMVKYVFISYFKYNIDDESVKEVEFEEIEERKVEEKEEYFDIIPKKRKRSEKTINMINI